MFIPFYELYRVTGRATRGLTRLGRGLVTPVALGRAAPSRERRHAFSVRCFDNLLMRNRIIAAWLELFSILICSKRCLHSGGRQVSKGRLTGGVPARQVGVHAWYAVGGPYETEGFFYRQSKHFYTERRVETWHWRAYVGRRDGASAAWARRGSDSHHTTTTRPSVGRVFATPPSGRTRPIEVRIYPRIQHSGNRALLASKLNKAAVVAAGTQSLLGEGGVTCPGAITPRPGNLHIESRRGGKSGSFEEDAP